MARFHSMMMGGAMGHVAPWRGWSGALSAMRHVWYSTKAVRRDAALRHEAALACAVVRRMGAEPFSFLINLFRVRCGAPSRSREPGEAGPATSRAAQASKRAEGA